MAVSIAVPPEMPASILAGTISGAAMLIDVCPMIIETIIV
jgi:hypothetical protein